MIVVLLSTVTLRGQDVHAGEEIDIPEDSAKSLVAAGMAAELVGDIPGYSKNDTLGGLKSPDSSNASGEPTQRDEEALAKLTKALDDQYKRDELAVAAKAVGVEFMYDAKKSDIIAAVIEQGKEAALLK